MQGIGRAQRASDEGKDTFKMKNFHTVMVVLCVMFTFSAVVVNSASAEVTLLALWLVGGAEATVQSSTTEGELLLEDTETIAGKAAMICTGILDGTIGPDGESAITEILNLKGGKIELGLLALLGTGAGSDCRTETGCAEGTAASPIEIYPLGLPWKDLLFLMENGQILDLFFATEIGYEILCLILGINAEDRCSASDEEILVENNATTGDAFTPVKSKVTPNVTCTQSGGKATGIEETETESIMTASGGLVTVSSE